MSWFTSARRHPSAVLLLVQLLGVLVYPAMEGSRGGRVGFEILGIFVLVLAVFSVRSTPGLTWVSIGLGIPAVVLSLVDAFNPTQPVVAVSGVLHAAFYFYAAYSLLRYMLSDHDVSTDELYATGATFTLVAWVSPTCTCSSRCWCPAASRRPSTPPTTAPGWNCCS